MFHSLRDDLGSISQTTDPATSKSGKSLRIYFGTQVRSDPSTFMLYVYGQQLMHFTYRRYLENKLREEYKFTAPHPLCVQGEEIADYLSFRNL